MFNQDRPDMKKRALKFYDKIVMALLGIFSLITGCDEPRMMYGTPSAHFLIKGTVTDELSTTPIKDIRIIIRDSRDSMYVGADTVYSDSNGKYVSAFNNYPVTEIEYIIKTEDIDGVANGGPYISEQIATTFEGATWDYSDVDSWYVGTATITKDIKLTK